MDTDTDHSRSTQSNPREDSAHEDRAHEDGESHFESQPTFASHMQKAVKAEACGKTIIVGEHAVVYGAQAIAMPLKDMRLQLNLSLRPHDARSTAKLISETLRAVVDEAFQLLAQKQYPYHLDCQSQILIGAGLGSSAALCVALVRAIAKVLNLKLSDAAQAKFANKLECHFHGTSSGLDTAVVALEQIIAFNRGLPPVVLDVEQKMQDTARFALIDSSTRASTAAMVQIASPYFKGSEGNRRLQRFNDIATQAIHSFKAGVVDELADAMNHAGAMLEEAKVVSDNLKNIIDELRRIGVKAAKSTGAGGGGYVLALLDREQDVQFQKIQQTFGAGKVILAGLP